MASEARCWYLNQKGKAAGPFTFGELKLMSAEGKLKGHDLVYKEGSSEWKRAYDWPEIVAECFQEENKSAISRLVAVPEEARAIEDQWVLLVREDGEKDVRFRQKGPFTTDEVRRMLAENKVKVSDHIWKKGDSKWVPLFEIPEFKINNQKMTHEAEKALSQVASMPEHAELPAETPLSQVVASEAERLEAAAADEDSVLPAAHDQQSVVDWARDLVESEEVKPEHHISAASKALIFEPEATKVNISTSESSNQPEVSEEAAMKALVSDDLGVFSASEEPILNPDEDESEATRYVPKAHAANPAVVSEPVPLAAVSLAPEAPVSEASHLDSEDEEEDFVMGAPAAPPLATPQLVAAKVAEVPVVPPTATPKVLPKATPKDQAVAAMEAAPAVKSPQGYSVYEAPEPISKGFLHVMAPVFGVLIIGVFALGFWATVNTDRSALQTPSPVAYHIEPIKQPRPMPVVTAPKPASPPTAPQVSASPSSTPAHPDEPMGVAEAPQPTVQPAASPQAEVKAEATSAVGLDGAPLPADAKAEVAHSKPPTVFKNENEPNKAPASESANTNAPAVKLNSAQTHVEITGPFKKGDLLRIRVDGRPGQILDIPALVQRYEVRANQDNLFKISMKDARIPQGDFQVSVQFGVNKFTRTLSVGKENPQFANLLAAHRKMVIFEQQQEKKRLIKATKELTGLVTQVETQPQSANNVKKALRDLDKMTPKELRMVRQSRYQLFYGESWEKLAQQWDRVQSNLKENTNRNPASIAEFLRIKKAASLLESEVRNISFWE